MNNIDIKVGALYKLKNYYDKSFFQYDHGEKYVMILDEDYSGLHPIIKVLIYYKKGLNKNKVGLWDIRSFERWEIFSETR